MRVESLEGCSSPLVASVRRLRFEATGRAPTALDGCWSLVVQTWDVHRRMLRTGLATRAMSYSHEAGEEMIVVSFHPEVVLPALPRLPNAAAVLEGEGGRAWLGVEAVELPAWGNVDAFVEGLARRGLVAASPTLASLVAHRPLAASERTRQRHFRRATGLTPKAFSQAERARRAVALIERGEPAADVAYALGYADQPHLIRSLKAITGRTPGQIARGAPVGNLQALPVAPA